MEVDTIVEDVEISVKDYVEASSEAAKRTRTVMVVLMIASVLMFSALLNSSQSNWKLQRVRALENVNSDYVRMRLGPPPPRESDNYSVYMAHYDQIYSAALKDYIENSYTIRIPFFGIAIDANDLGPLGGLALAVILALYRTSITRELDNLKLSFEGAEAQNQLSTLYYLLAMRQVLAFPNIHTSKRSRFMKIVPKILIFIPLVIYSVIVTADFYTLTVVYVFSSQGITTLIQDALFFVIIVAITASSLMNLKEIDNTWAYYWNILGKAQIRDTDTDSSIPDA